jgi:hypothetical protein
MRDRAFDLVETVRTRDRAVDLPDGSWITIRIRPSGEGWTILRDRERATVWTRRKPILWRPVRRRAGGWDGVR